jgi:hypothetical protein
MSASVLNLTPDSTERPIVKMTLQIIKDAVRLNADAILLELDMELHLRTQKEYGALVQLRDKKLLTHEQFFFKFSRLPTAFNITYTIEGKPDPTPSANGELFENVVRIILLTTGIPPWTKGEIVTSFETIKPTSKWTFESKDLTRRAQLKRIRAS